MAPSDSFRFPACNFIKNEIPVKMFICEFCKIFKNIFRQKHLRLTASCVYLCILRSFSNHFLHKAPLGNCLFHLQVAEIQPPHTIKEHFTSAFQAFYTRRRRRRRSSYLKEFPYLKSQKLSVKKLIYNKAARSQPAS